MVRLTDRQTDIIMDDGRADAHTHTHTQYTSLWGTKQKTGKGQQACFSFLLGAKLG